jgi:hypothetical protein
MTGKHVVQCVHGQILFAFEKIGSIIFQICVLLARLRAGACQVASAVGVIIRQILGPPGKPGEGEQR